MNPAQFWALCEIHCYRSNVHKHKECFFGRKYFLRNSIWPRGSRPLKRWESGHSRDFPRTGVIKWGFTAPKSAFSKYNIFFVIFKEEYQSVWSPIWTFCHCLPGISLNLSMKVFGQFIDDKKWSVSSYLESSKIFIVCQNFPTFISVQEAFNNDHIHNILKLPGRVENP